MSANYCSEEYLDVVNGVRGGMFLLSFLACLVVTVAWIWSAFRHPDKERWTKSSLYYTADRLPFYVLVAALFHSVVSITQLTTISHDKNSFVIVVCEIVAFLTTLTETGMLLISIIAPAHLILIKWKRFSGWLEDTGKKVPLILEVGYIITVIVGSLTAASVPFLCLPFGVTCYGYDPEGQWCWIKARDENCTRISAGWYMQIALFFTPTFIGFLLILVVLGYIVFTIFRQGCSDFKTKLSVDERDQGVTRSMIVLTLCLFSFSLFNIISFCIRFNRIPNKANTLVLSIDHSLWGLIPSAAVATLVYFDWKGVGKDGDRESILNYGSIQDT